MSVHKIPLAKERKLILVGILLVNHSAKDSLYHLAFFFMYSCTEHKDWDGVVTLLIYIYICNISTLKEVAAAEF